MQELHLVGITTDRQHLILSVRRGAKSGSYRVAVDEELRDVVDELADEIAARAEEAAVAPPRPDAQLSVREMQARLRAGATTSEVADEAGVDEDWVERFAVPVLAEQQRIIALARSLPMVRTRHGPSAEPLDVAVRRSMDERGVRFPDGGFDAAWSTRLSGSSTWTIEFSYRHRNQDRTVTWTLDVDEQRLTTSDRSASQIGFVAAEASEDDARSRPSARSRRSSGRSSTAAATGPRGGGGGEDRTPAADGPRSTRGDGRPDTVPSTRDVDQFRQAAASALENPRAHRRELDAAADPVAADQGTTDERERVPSASVPVDDGAEPEAPPPPFVPAGPEDDEAEVSEAVEEVMADEAGASDRVDDPGSIEDVDDLTASEQVAEVEKVAEVAEPEEPEEPEESEQREEVDQREESDEFDELEEFASTADLAGGGSDDDESAVEDEPEIAFDFGSDHLPDAEVPDAEVPDAEVPDAEVPDADEPDADEPDAEGPSAEAAERRRPTVRFRSGAAMRAADVDVALDAGLGPDREPGGDPVRVARVRRPETETAHEIQTDDGAEDGEQPDDPWGGSGGESRRRETPSTTSSNGRSRRRRTRPLRAR